MSDDRRQEVIEILQEVIDVAYQTGTINATTATGIPPHPGKVYDCIAPLFEREFPEKEIPENAILCYIDEGNMAYFTTQSLDKQWGDDWNDVPYEHNAGSPYKKEGHQIFEVAFYGPFETPAERNGINSIYSVEMINAGATPWLWWSNTNKEPGKIILIYAGISLKEFSRSIKIGGGVVKHLWEDKKKGGCPTCEGMGKRPIPRISMQQQNKVWESCPDCKGTGERRDGEERRKGGDRRGIANRRRNNTGRTYATQSGDRRSGGERRQ